MSETISTQATLPSAVKRTERDQMIALLLKPGELAWLLEERYEAATSSWMIAIVRQDAQARWMYQRYRYDSAVDVLFFLGERQMSEDEFATARRTGKAVRI